MDFELILNWLSLAAYFFLSYGVLDQILRIRKSGKTSGIDRREVAIRAIVTVVLMIKIAYVGDPYLVVGHVFLTAILLVYAFILFRQHR
jgi:hypothetical protein